jgi:hypothetical protein
MYNFYKNLVYFANRVILGSMEVFRENVPTVRSTSTRIHVVVPRAKTYVPVHSIRFYFNRCVCVHPVLLLHILDVPRYFCCLICVTPHILVL